MVTFRKGTMWEMKIEPPLTQNKRYAKVSIVRTIPDISKRSMREFLWGILIQRAKEEMPKGDLKER